MRAMGVALAVVLVAVGLFLQGGAPAFALDNCSTASAEFCINVGETAKIKVTNQLLQYFCVDQQGKPDHELVQPNVTGEPTTGGAGATFVPEVFRAYSGFSTLQIHTTVNTKPGNYTLVIGATGEHCGIYPTRNTYLLVRPTVSGARSLWSFNGAEPAGYPTSTMLTAAPANMPPYTWYVIGSTPWLRLPNGQSSMTTNVNHIKVTAFRPNPKGSEPAIFVGVKGGLSLSHEIDVRTPAWLYLLDHKHYADAARGYRSVWRYAAVDQLGDWLPSTLLPVTISWLSSHTELFANNNWTRSPSGRRALSNPRSIAFAVVPRTDGGLPVNVGIPRPLSPSGGSTKIDCWRAAINLGGDDVHSGVRVDSQIWLRFRDHGTTEATKCP